MTMKQLNSIFDFQTARSGGVEDYATGPIPFVTSTELNNGVVAYVMPDDDDRVFIGPAIAISGLGYATVHLRHFLPKGNGGDSLTILKPKSTMTVEQLVSLAASFNALHKWRFSFGRKCSIGRLEGLRLPFPPKQISDIWDHEKETLNTLASHIRTQLDTLALPFPSDQFLADIPEGSDVPPV